MSSTENLADTITAIAINAGGRWVPLATLRAKINSYTDITASRDEVDAAITDLMRTRAIRVLPQEVQHRLTTADREAALWLGGEYKHFIARP